MINEKGLTGKAKDIKSFNHVEKAEELRNIDDEKSSDRSRSSLPQQQISLQEIYNKYLNKVNYPETEKILFILVSREVKGKAVCDASLCKDHTASGKQDKYKTSYEIYTHYVLLKNKFEADKELWISKDEHDAEIKRLKEEHQRSLSQQNKSLQFQINDLKKQLRKQLKNIDKGGRK
jgi:hypothetical protein